MKLQLLVISGSQAKDAFHRGITDPETLKTLGFCRTISFDSIPEQNAFIEGFELAQNLKGPILHDRSRSTESSSD